MIFFSVFQDLLGVLVYGIVFYPYFACLTTEYKLIGSVLGLLYGSLRYISSIIAGQVRLVFCCEFDVFSGR